VLPVIIEHHVGPGAAAPLHVHHGIHGDQPQPDPASLNYTAMNTVAGQSGQPVLGPPMSQEEARAIIARGR
jgi:hypothetical protein